MQLILILKTARLEETRNKSILSITRRSYLPYPGIPGRTAKGFLGHAWPKWILVGRGKSPHSRPGAKRARRGTTIDDHDTGVIHPEATEPHPADQSASKRKRTTQRPSLPTRTSRSARLIPTPPGTDGAASESVSDSDMEAPHTHLVTTPREKRVRRDLATLIPPFYLPYLPPLLFPAPLFLLLDRLQHIPGSAEELAVGPCGSGSDCRLRRGSFALGTGRR